ncbi:MAG TPA: ATP-binding protein, partial [Pseudodesulfovibrio sp.]|nr:ATP-binding protein [Pseudodesulfovibrio sp.]
VILVVSLFLAYFLSSKLQKVISGPILHLAETARLVSTKKNYSIRAGKQGQDELGDLVDGFNEMLSQIQLRDQELGQHQENLRAEVTARTAELQTANDELSEAKVKAESASIAKSEFLATMSHEIRTPMNAIVGMTEITLQTELTEDQRDYLKTVKDSAQHLLSIINDILDLSKIEARKLELDHVDFDLPFHVRTTIKGLELQARQKGLNMTLEIDDSVPHCVKGDPLSLRQVLVNLAGNAVKFTHRGAITIRVRAAEGPAPDETRPLGVAFAVEDTGIGIPREFLDSIFQSFSQSTRAFGGTGLGLAICKQLILLMGGDIQVESNVGKGSIFSFSVWFEQGFSCPMPDEDDTYRRPEAPSRPVRVLVAEDNDVNIMVTT